MNIVYAQEWHSYEEWGGVKIFEDEKANLFVQYGGYCVMAPENDPSWGELEPINYPEALGGV